MSSIGDIGREFERMKDDPQPAHPATELDQLEQRLDAFLAWGKGRPQAEIRDRFDRDFAASTLDDTTVSAIGDGRSADVRPALAEIVKGSPR
jgi:phytoene/squalene synthetase